MHKQIENQTNNVVSRPGYPGLSSQPSPANQSKSIEYFHATGYELCCKKQLWKNFSERVSNKIILANNE